jgi:hypothetical protein
MPIQLNLIPLWGKSASIGQAAIGAGSGSEKITAVSN